MWHRQFGTRTIGGCQVLLQVVEIWIPSFSSPVWSLGFVTLIVHSPGLLNMVSDGNKLTNTVWCSFTHSVIISASVKIENLMFTCNQCKREIPLVPPSRSCSLHYSLECLVGVPAEATCAPVSKASTRQKPKTWEPCFSWVKVNDTELLWAQELVVIWAIQCILGQYQGANGHGQTHEVGFLSSGLI